MNDKSQAEVRAVAIQSGARVVIKALETLGKGLDYRALGVLGATIVALVYSVPEERRYETVAAAIAFFQELLVRGWLPWLGWFLLVPIVIVSITYTAVAERRIAAMGEDQRKRREADDPDRVSSRDKEALAAQVRARAEDKQLLLPAGAPDQKLELPAPRAPVRKPKRKK